MGRKNSIQIKDDIPNSLKDTYVIRYFLATGQEAPKKHKKIVLGKKMMYVLVVRIYWAFSFFLAASRSLFKVLYFESNDQRGYFSNKYEFWTWF